MTRFLSWVGFVLGAVFMILPLVGTFMFSLRAKRGELSFQAYHNVLADPQLQSTFLFSAAAALATIAVGILLVLPAAYWVRLRLPGLRPVMEFVSLLPLVVPAVVIAFGYIRQFNTSSFLPLTGSALGSNILLIAGYSVLSLPYMYRAIDTGLRTLDVATLTEAAQSLGAGWGSVLYRVILPNLFGAVLSGAFLTFAIVIGEYVFAALLDRPAFGPYMVWMGGNKAYEPAALAVMAFAVTWACMGLMQLATRLSRHARSQSR